MPEFDAILFDFDGVLADTEPVTGRAGEVLKPFAYARMDYYRITA